jgi:protein TonB
LLSLLALAIGIAGTQWLSGLTADRRGPSVRHRASSVQPAERWAMLGARRPMRSQGAPSSAIHPTHEAVASRVSTTSAPDMLVPLAMPSSMPAYAAMRGHLDGRVVLRLSVDGEGAVRAASVDRSSGDARLDAYALATVREWRFAVPADHPDGLQGDLPMRFTTDELAQSP